MNVPAHLVRLYPPGIRERWGSEIVHEAQLAGPRSWFDTAAGAARLWLRPSDWPETASGQTSRVLVTAFVAVITAGALLVRAAGPVSPTSAWLVPILAGAVLAAPLPPLRRAPLARLAATAARTLGAPVLAFGVLLALAHSGLVAHPAGVVDVLLVTYYWATLGFIGIHGCLLAARVGEIAVPPSTRRLRLALLLLGAGLALASAQSLAAGVVVPSGGFAALAAAVLSAGIDLRRIAR